MNSDIVIIEKHEEILGFQNVIEKKLQEYNFKHVGFGNYELICFQITDKNNTKDLGGIVASVYLNLLTIESFWIEENFRNLGYGTQLLNAVEQKAKLMSCTKSSLETYSFQSAEFYLNRGFRIFGSIDMQSYTKIFLAKQL